jgi:glycosyltransferase involved in cell wall biosynthesis
MKILLIGPIPPPIDGCSNANKVLFKNFTNRGIDCDIVNTNTSIITNEQGRKFSFKKAFLFLRNYRAISKIIRADIVYFTPGQTFYGVLKYAPFIIACLLLHRPYVIHVHGNFLGEQYKMLSGAKKRLFSFLISNATAGVVITKSLTKIFEKLLPEKKVYVVDYFVEEELHKEVKAKLVDKPRILYLSNLMKEKGILEFLDALIEIKNKKIDFQAAIAGSIESGLEDHVHSKFALLGNAISYLGVITGPEKVRAFQEANIFILPTYYTMEGLPFSILEAIATGNIIISTVHAGIPDIINESNGFLVEKRSSKAIATCIESINLNLKETIKTIAQHNINYARSNFTEKKYTDSIMAILENSLIKR